MLTPMTLTLKLFGELQMLLTSCVPNLDRVAEINKKAAWSLCNGVWMTHSDINKVKVISELLSVRHSYVNLDCFSSEDIDFMIEFMCTD